MFAALCAALGAGFAAVPDVAGAATPSEICRAISEGTFNPTNYSAGDIAAYTAALSSDPTIQGYCSPIVVVAASCIEVPPGTTGAVLGADGKYYINAPNGNGAGCGTRPTTPCVAVPANTPGAVQASNGTWYLNAPNGSAEACAPRASAAATPTRTVTVTVPAAPVTRTAEVKAATKAKARPQTLAAPTKRTAAPLVATTKPAGTLPFTGAELAVFAIAGLALLAGGFLLRRTARQKRARI